MNWAWYIHGVSVHSCTVCMCRWMLCVCLRACVSVRDTIFGVRGWKIYQTWWAQQLLQGKNQSKRNFLAESKEGDSLKKKEIYQKKSKKLIDMLQQLEEPLFSPTQSRQRKSQNKSLYRCEILHNFEDGRRKSNQMTITPPMNQIQRRSGRTAHVIVIATKGQRNSIFQRKLTAAEKRR